jgi:CubicO group peptidase (beta-lactamase class C family)
MKKFYLCKLCLIVFGALLAVQSVVAANWNGGFAKTDKNGCIAEKTHPNLIQLRRMLTSCMNKDRAGNGRIKVPASDNPRKLEFDVSENEHVNLQLAKTGLISYLLYRNGKVVTDAITPKDRLGDLFDNTTIHNSQSVGKTLTGYLMGHAICQGYISGLDQTISDWPLMQGTPYENRKIIDLINMNVGDSHLSKGSKIRFKNGFNKDNPNHQTMEYWGNALQGKRELTSRTFNYSQLVSNMMHNYIQYKAGNQYEHVYDTKIFKTGSGYEQLIDLVYRQKAGIEYGLELGRNDAFGFPEEGLMNTNVLATRYDYLRILISMLEDWQNDTCVGKYLKELYERSVSGLPGGRTWLNESTYRRYNYGGYFYMNVRGTGRNVYGMSGYGGQNFFVNFDTGTIVIAQAVHQNYDLSLIFDEIIK